MTVICFVLEYLHGRHAWREGDSFRGLTGTNVTSSDYISLKTIAMYHADMSSSRPFVPLGKMHLFMLFI